MRKRLGWAKAAQFLGGLILIWWGPRSFADLTAHDYSVELTADIIENPASITLRWLPDSNATIFQISRKTLGNPDWSAVALLDGSQSSWSDHEVTLGTAYEYRVIKSTGLGYSGYGYICSAIRRSPVEDRGKIILLVESDLGSALPLELARLQEDLIGDGWTVIRQDISKSADVTTVKNFVQSVYQADPYGTKALFLFGHLPVPYSGEISPDLHDNDIGAWPADVYYGEFDGAWTDTTVNRPTSANSNTPGDGRFDQNEPPGPVRLQIGRVDLSNLTCFANKTPARYELDLARQYLSKDHAFRHGGLDVQRRGLIFSPSYRGLEPEPQTCAAWRSFPSFFGRDQIRTIGPDEYFPTLDAESYLWSYVVSGGSTYGSDNVGTSDSWALNEPKVIFTSFLGSYFGNWNQESDFLRAPLGTSEYTLTCIFSGQPPWILHTMAMGEPIGQAALLTQNNRPGGIYPPQLNAGAGQVHIALMGDPTLRMHPVKPPGNLNGIVNANGVTLTWDLSGDGAVSGYYIYKSTSEGGPFTRISEENAAATSFTDSAGDAQSHYMVRALKLEQTPAGSYYNLSQGIFFPDLTTPSEAPQAPRDLEIRSIVQGGVTLQWNNPSEDVRSFEIQRRTLPGGTFTKIGEAPGIASSFSDLGLAPVSTPIACGLSARRRIPASRMSQRSICNSLRG
jgi:hypothetical protein